MLIHEFRVQHHLSLELRIKDPSPKHPHGKYTCEVCEHGARLEWDPCDDDDDDDYDNHYNYDYDGGDDDDDDDADDERFDESEEQAAAAAERKEFEWVYEGRPKLERLRQHAATRQHIRHAQVSKFTHLTCALESICIGVLRRSACLVSSIGIADTNILFSNL